MKRIFVLTNHKGGVGKSTSSTNIALGIASILRRVGAANSRVLLIDTDSQGHATLVTTGRNNFGAEDSLHAVLSADRANAAQVLLKSIVPSTWHEDLHVLPVSPLLEGAERELMRVAGAPYRLADPLNKIASQYAAIIIDKFRVLRLRDDRKDSHFLGAHHLVFALINLRHLLAHKFKQVQVLF
jgi:chromosome partitioning protein